MDPRVHHKTECGHPMMESLLVLLHTRDSRLYTHSNWLGRTQKKGSRHNEIFLHLNPFVLSLLLRNQQLLSFETF